MSAVQPYSQSPRWLTFGTAILSSLDTKELAVLAKTAKCFRKFLQDNPRLAQIFSSHLIVQVTRPIETGDMANSSATAFPKLRLAVAKPETPKSIEITEDLHMRVILELSQQTAHCLQNPDDGDACVLIALVVENFKTLPPHVQNRVYKEIYHLHKDHIPPKAPYRYGEFAFWGKYGCSSTAAEKIQALKNTQQFFRDSRVTEVIE